MLDGLYDDWVITERYRLQALFQDGLARLMVACERHDAPRAALAAALRLLAADPLREDAYRAAMRAYHRLGQRSAALEQYRRCRETIREELAAEPEAETAELYEAILAGEGTAGTVSEAGALTLPEAPVPAGRSPVAAGTSSAFVGRDPGMALLHQAWQAVQAGAGRLVLVSGEAGVRKTRLAEEFSAHLRWQGTSVLWGRCFEIERGLSYQPIVEAVRAVLPGVGPKALDHVPRWALAELARLLPELPASAAHGAEAPGPAAAGIPGNRARLFEALACLLAALSARGPLLVVLEDLHWASSSMLELLHYLVRHLRERAILIVGTLRLEGPQPADSLLALQQQLGREGLVDTLHLPRLSLEDVQTIVAEMSGAGEAALPLATRLYHDTEGNPFYLMQIVKVLFERNMVRLREGRWEADFAALARQEIPLPSGIRDAVRARLSALEADAHEASELAAVAGDEFDFDLLAEVWRHGRERLLGALDGLLRHGVIAEAVGAVERDYAFTHHKIREAIYLDLPRRRRQDAHGRVGLAMEGVYAGQVAALAAELAYHFEQACAADRTLVPKAVRYLLQAGDQARGLYAHEEAIGHYTRALRLLEGQRQYGEAARTLMKLGLTHHSAFHFSQAREAYDRGCALWQRDYNRTTPMAAAPHALRVELYPAPSQLDPTRVFTPACYAVVSQLFSALVRQTPQMDVIPEVASHWDVLEGGRRYAFHLREDARWSDGAPVTAGDFLYAWIRLLDPAQGLSWAEELDVVSGARDYRTGRLAQAEQVGIQAPGERTLLVDLDAPASHFLHLLALLYPVPRHIVQRDPDGWARAGSIVSNGPFQLEAWREGQGMVLVRNPCYAGNTGGNVERVEICTSPEWAARRLMYESGTLDVLSLLRAPLAEWERLQQRHAGEFVSAPELSLVRLIFNAWRPPFADLRVRQAFAHATDREALVNAVLGGRASPAMGGQVPPGMVGHSPGIGLPYDPIRARELLAGAGYPGGRGFPPLQALVPEPMAEQARELRAQWGSVLGIDVSWREMAWPRMLEEVRARLPDMFLSGWAADYPDPETFLAAGSRVLGGHVWHDETYEQLLGQSQASLDQEERIAILRQADRLLTQQGPMLTLYYLRYGLLIKPWVKRYPLSPLGPEAPYWQDAIIDPH